MTAELFTDECFGFEDERDLYGFIVLITDLPLRNLFEINSDTAILAFSLVESVLFI